MMENEKEKLSVYLGQAKENRLSDPVEMVKTMLRIARIDHSHIAKIGRIYVYSGDGFALKLSIDGYSSGGYAIRLAPEFVDGCEDEDEDVLKSIKAWRYRLSGSSSPSKLMGSLNTLRSEYGPVLRSMFYVDGDEASARLWFKDRGIDIEMARILVSKLAKQDRNLRKIVEAIVGTNYGDELLKDMYEEVSND